MPRLPVLLAAAAVLALAAPPASANLFHTHWVRKDTTQQQAKADVAQCQYEAKLSTANFALMSQEHRDRAHYKNLVSDAVSSGVAEGIEHAELIVSCMHARGYTQL